MRIKRSRQLRNVGLNETNYLNLLKSIYDTMLSRASNVRLPNQLAIYSKTSIVVLKCGHYAHLGSTRGNTNISLVIILTQICRTYPLIGCSFITGEGRNPREAPKFFELKPRLSINMPRLLINGVKLVSLHVK